MTEDMFVKDAIENNEFTIEVEINADYEMSKVSDVFSMINKFSKPDIKDIIDAGVESSKIKIQYPILVEPDKINKNTIYFVCNYKIQN